MNVRHFCLIAMLLLAGCATALPQWAVAPPTPTAAGLRLVGISYPSPDERSARESAIQGAMSEFLRYTGVEVESYIKMRTRETSAAGQPGQVAMDNLDTTTLASRGFVRQVEQKAWKIVRSDDGRYVAYVDLLIPAAEVARVQQAQVEEQAEAKAPYLAAKASFDQALRGHQLLAAAQIIPELVSLGPAAGQRHADAGRYAQAVLDNVAIRPCQDLVFDLDHPAQSTLNVCVEHQNAGAAGVPLEIATPAGTVVKAITHGDGRAVVALPSPSHPGVYPLQVRLVLPGIPERRQTLALHVVGSRETLSDGRFHAYVEAQGTGEADGTYANRTQAESVALATARQDAYAKLVVLCHGLDVAADWTTENTAATESRTLSRASGYLQAQPVKERVSWPAAHAVATVIFRASLAQK